MCDGHETVCVISKQFPADKVFGMLGVQRKLWWPKLCNVRVSGLHLSRQQKTWRRALRD